MSIESPLRDLNIDLPSCPSTLVKMSLLMADEHTTTEQLALVIETDMALSAAVVRTVNSALSAPFRGAHIARPAQDAARELLTVLDGLQPQDSGSFWAYDGQRLPW